MANNYTLFAEAIPMPHEAARYACDLEETINAIAQDNPDDAEIYPEPMASDARAILAAHRDEWWFGTGAHFSSDDDFLIITSDECGDLEAAAVIVRATMVRFGLTDPIAIVWANTCSAIRPGEFGGGAVVITSRGERWMTTAEFVAGAVHDLALDDGFASA